MNKFKIRKCLSILTVIILLMEIIPAFGFENTDHNRFNVMIVLDASGSMNNTDPNGFRYDAINQFSNLLAAEGNYLGGIVFSTAISAKQEPIAINSQQNKEQVTNLLHSVDASGWTNTGDALLTSVDLLKSNGDPNLPSVIVFLSDGNTEMGTKDETVTSLNQKAEAIQAARENNISIYTVCLNADKSADISEMEQISKATGGVFQEVGSAEDLQDVFNAFYNLIYGTSTVMLLDEKFPENGVVEKQFEIPGIGVEEVNIIVYGKTTNIILTKPDGTQSDTVPIVYDSFSMMKITDVMPGTWKITTSGVPGDQIKINMVYNTNLGVDLKIDSDENVINPSDAVKLVATLKAGSQYASSGGQYSGYSAQLHILDAYGEEITSVPMRVIGEQFETSQRLEEGTYNFKVTVTGNYLDKESEIVGPLRVTSEVLSEEEKNNTPPEPVESPVQKTVYIWPIKGGEIEIDLNTLATDAQDSELRYKILSSSFVEDTDYTVTADEILTVNHFSLSKGAFTVRATDSGGLSCDIEIIIKTHNIGLIAVIGMGIVALIILAAIAIITYRSLGITFMGSITVENIETGETATMHKNRGRLKLKTLQIGQTGINRDSYFQASGKNFIYLRSKRPVFADNGVLKKTKKIKIESSMDVRVSSNQEFNTGIVIRFESMLNNLY